MKKFLLFGTVTLAFMLSSCGHKDANSSQSGSDETSFQINQPLQSGTYEASYYDISGDNARKGHFDGRLLVSLSPDVSALYVYENGNHAKIQYLIMLDKPFEKGDSATYRALDKEGKQVVIKKDSVASLTFDKKDSKIYIEFDSIPKSTQPAFDVLQRINELRGK